MILQCVAAIAILKQESGKLAGQDTTQHKICPNIVLVRHAVSKTTQFPATLV